MAVNDFLPFATSSTANVIDQVEYAAAPWGDQGFSAGIAMSAHLNKVWRQSSFVGAGIAQFMMDQTGYDIVDDGDLDKFVQQFKDSFSVALVGQGDARWVNISGDTMSGLLLLSGDPVDLLGAVTKQYTDNGFAYIGGILTQIVYGYLPLSGGTLTGPLYLYGTPVAPNEAATVAYVQSYVDGVFSGSGAALDPRYVNVAGDEMTGGLGLRAGLAIDGPILGWEPYGLVINSSAAMANVEVYGDLAVTGTISALSNVDVYGAGISYPGVGENSRIGFNWDQTNNILGLWVDGAYINTVTVGSSGLDQANADALYVNVVGDSMSGQLTLGAGLHVNGGLSGSQYSIIADNVIHARGALEAMKPSFFNEGLTVGTTGGITIQDGGLSVGRNAAVGGGIWIGGIYPGLNYTINVGGNAYVATNLDMGGNLNVAGSAVIGLDHNVYRDSYVQGHFGANLHGSFGMGLWVGGQYPGYGWTLAVSGAIEIATSGIIWGDFVAHSGCYVDGNFTAASAAIVGLITCQGFQTFGDSTHGASLSVAATMTAGTAVGAPTIVAYDRLHSSNAVNCVQYLLNGLAFAHHGGNTLILVDPGNHASLICYAGNSTNYYSNLAHQWVDYGYTVTYALFNGSGTYNVTGLWGQLSDADLKRDIAPYERGLEALRRLQPVSFVYNEAMPFGDDGGTTRYGLVAQEVREIIPEMVSETMINNRTFSTVTPGHLVFILCNALKELADKYDQLERRLNDDPRRTERTERPRSGK